MSHTAAAAAAVSVAALLSTALTHTVQITGASVVTPLSAPLPFPSLSGWMISCLTDIGSLCSRMFVNSHTSSQEFASPHTDVDCGGGEGVEERQCFLFNRQKSIWLVWEIQTTIRLCLQKGEMKREQGGEREDMTRLTVHFTRCKEMSLDWR